MTRALIVVDTQVDFSEGGSLAVSGGAQVADGIAAMVALAGQPWRNYYSRVLATKDWHINPKGHFSETPDYLNTWPAHCVAGTWGAELHPNVQRIPFDAVFYKGLTTAAYSGFEGFTPVDLPQKFELLGDYLARYHIEEVDICGIASDYCVRATALDSAGLGLKTRVWWDLCAGVDPESTAAAEEDMKTVGIEIERAFEHSSMDWIKTTKKADADS